MAEVEQTEQAEQEEAPRKKGGKKRKVFFLVALIGAVIAFLTFRRHRGDQE